ncbi:MAG TPA: hypothetical protein PL141_11805 [Thermoflexales bacterium]|nr:hypothetical protein [Thermoflexales bacterium]
MISPSVFISTVSNMVCSAMRFCWAASLSNVSPNVVSCSIAV